MPLPRKNIKHIDTLYRLVVERTNAEIKKEFETIAPDLKPSVKDQAIRLIPKSGKIYTDEELKALFAKLNLTFERIIEPGSVLDNPESKSSKFPTYAVKDQQGVLHYIVQGKGSAANKGEEFERQTRTTIEAAIESGDINRQNNIPLLYQFKELLGNTDLVFTDFKHGRVTRRALQSVPNDAGEVIADFVLYDTEKKPYYISLKNESGDTFSNNGIGGMFKQSGNQIIATNESFDIDPLLTAVGIDRNKIAKGATDYLTRTLSGPGLRENTPVALDDEKKKVIKGYLESAFDYGYYYIRQKEENTDNYLMTSLMTDTELSNFVGTIKEVYINYPYFAGTKRTESRKGGNIYITAESGPLRVMESGKLNEKKIMKHRFVFQIRNASRGIAPVQINGMFA